MPKLWILVTIAVIAIFGLLALYALESREGAPAKETSTEEISVKQVPSKTKNTIKHPELGDIQPPIPPGATIKESDRSFKDELTDDMKRSIREDVESRKLWYEANIGAGFSEDGAAAMASGDPFRLLSVDDMPLVLQEEIRRELIEREKHGYDLISDERGDEILRIKEYVNKDPKTISQNINFTLSEIPESLANDDGYEYIGHAFPGTPLSQSEDETYGTIRRVYESTSDPEHLIVVQETSLASGSSTMVDAFVNTDVNEYPATYSEKKTKSGGTYAMLAWTTRTSSYSVYQVGSVDDQTEDKMGSMAGEIVDVNAN